MRQNCITLTPAGFYLIEHIAVDPDSITVEDLFLRLLHGGRILTELNAVAASVRRPLTAANTEVELEILPHVDILVGGGKCRGGKRRV